MKQICALTFALIATPASAWTVTHERDRMTDKQLTWASARSGDATLLFGCMNGQPIPRLTWPDRKGVGSGIGVTWRVDEGPIRVTAAGLFSQDGRTLYPWVSGGLAARRRIPEQAFALK